MTDQEQTRVFETEDSNGDVVWLVESRSVLFASEEEALAWCERVGLVVVD